MTVADGARRHGAAGRSGVSRHCASAPLGSRPHGGRSHKRSGCDLGSRRVKSGGNPSRAPLASWGFRSQVHPRTLLALSTSTLLASHAFFARGAKAGKAPLDLWGVPTAKPLTLAALPCVRWSAASCDERSDVETLRWHETHHHRHFEHFALYELRTLTPDGVPDLSLADLVTTANQASFCLEAMDWDQPGSRLIGAYNTMLRGLARHQSELVRSLCRSFARPSACAGRSRRGAMRHRSDDRVETTSFTSDTRTTACGYLSRSLTASPMQRWSDRRMFGIVSKPKSLQVHQIVAKPVVPHPSDTNERSNENPLQRGGKPRRDPMGPPFQLP